MEIKEISDWIGVVGWFLTGFWFIRQHLIRREDCARIDMCAEIRRVTGDENNHVVEVIAEVKNSGTVRHYIRKVSYTIRGSDMNELRASPDLLHQVILPIVIAKDRRFFPPEWVYTFVDAGQKTTYRHLVLVPKNVKLLQLTAKMTYEDEKSDFHTATWVGTL